MVGMLCIVVTLLTYDDALQWKEACSYAHTCSGFAVLYNTSNYLSLFQAILFFILTVIVLVLLKLLKLIVNTISEKVDDIIF